MELMYPVFLWIGLAVILLLIFLRFKRTNKYKGGVRVVNADRITGSPYFIKLVRKYKVYKTISLVSLLLAIAVGFFMLSRVVSITTLDPEVENKDIFICLDISDSVDEVNLEVCDQLKNVVSSLQGERFGITIFNARSVLLVPLTTDYTYVQNTLDQLKKCFEQSLKKDNLLDFFNSFDMYTYDYKYEGTLCDYGSSFIGDGLAACLYEFDRLDEDPTRSRMIIFATDNWLNGEPFVTIEEATALCAKKGVKVYAIAPDNVVDEADFKKNIEKTGGQYYRASSARVVKDIIKQIRSLEGTKMTEKRTVVTDYPTIPFILMLVLVGIHLWTSRRIKE